MQNRAMASVRLKHFFLFFICLILQEFYNKGRVTACITDSEVFARVNGSCRFSYSVKGQIGGVTTFIFSGPNGDLAQFVYNSNNNVINTQTVRGVTVTADWNGNVQAIKSHITMNDIGMYSLSKSGRNARACSFLHILGIPTKPNIVSSYTTVGENATLICNSSSTTKPANHSLGLTYKWEIGNATDISSMSYIFSGNSLVITKVTESDARLEYTCTTTENVQDGFTSNRSTVFAFNISYGPDDETTVLLPSASSYIINEDTLLENITCHGICFPACNYKWMKELDNETSIIINSETLSLGIVSRNDTATYVCVVKNQENDKSLSKDVNVSVRYGPDAYTTILLPSMTSYSQAENTVLSNITCFGDCYPTCKYTWTRKSNGRQVTTGQKQVLSIGQLDRDDADTYICTVTNLDTNRTVTLEISISVIYGPDLNSTLFIPPPTTYILMEDTLLKEIYCAGDCVPECEYHWTKLDSDGVESAVNQSRVLSLGLLNRTKAAIYICTVSNPRLNETAKKELTILVTYGPYEHTTRLSPPAVSYTVNEYEQIGNITCYGECYPECDYYWTTSSGAVDEFSRNGKLVLGSIDRNDAGNYTCIVSNPDSNRTAMKFFWLDIYYGPDQQTTHLFPPTSSYTLDKESVLDNITCTGDCHPECEYIWTKTGNNGGVSVSNSNVLSLGSVDRNDTASYTCTLTNMYTNETVRKDLVVKIKYGPDDETTVLSPSRNTITVDEYSTLDTITCTSDCFPLCQYLWTREGPNGLIIVSDSTRLSLGMLTRRDAAVYMCTVSNPDRNGIVTKWIIIHVIYGPDRSFTNVQTPYIVTEGEEPDDIICSSNCYPVCSNTWTNMTDGRGVGSIGHFSLGTVTRYQSGDYMCTSRNAVTKHVKQTTLKVVVTYAPTVSITTSTTNFTEGTNVTIYCHASGVPPNYTYEAFTQTWENIQINNNHKPLHGNEAYSSIHIASLELQDSGNYSCIVGNGVADANGNLDQNASLFIKVKVIPKILKERLRFFGTVNGPVNVRVPFYSDPPIETADFRRNKNNLVFADDDRFSVSYAEAPLDFTFYDKHVTLIGNEIKITLNRLMQDDFGNYSLILENSIGRTAALVELLSKGKPFPPKTFKLLWQNGAPYFLWEKDSNGGHEQTFVIQTAEQYTSKWKNGTVVNENDKQFKKNNSYYLAKVRGLQNGTYTVRIIARNIIGETTPVYLSSALVLGVTNAEEDKSDKPKPYTEVIAGCSASFLVITAVCIVTIVIIRKRRSKCQADKSQEVRVSYASLHAEKTSDYEEPARYVSIAVYCKTLSASASNADDSMSKADDSTSKADDSTYDTIKSVMKEM